MIEVLPRFKIGLSGIDLSIIKLEDKTLEQLIKKRTETSDFGAFVENMEGYHSAVVAITIEEARQLILDMETAIEEDKKYQDDLIDYMEKKRLK